MRLLLLIFVTLILSSFKADKSGPWIVNKDKNIILYTRPLNYSKSVSPDSITIRKILDEQNQSIAFINNALNTNFNSKVIIYLYNYDEAMEKIGTNGGGFAFASRLLGKHIFFTYNSKLHESVKYQDFLGKHEMTHIIVGTKIGKTKTRLMAEGYANAVDWTYGCTSIDYWIKKYKAEHKMVKPSDLLINNGAKIPEVEFYPQSGYFIKWLFSRFGIKKVNKLYSINKENFIEEYKNVTGR